MKSFFKFLSEASLAVQQAQRMGLEGDGHGGWYKDGEFVAKTEKGRLVFYNKRQKLNQKDPKQTEKEKRISDPNFVDPTLQQPQAEVPPQEQQPPPEQQVPQEPQQPQQPVVTPPEVQKTKGTLTVAFGRFNPPTTGHEKLLDAVASNSDKGEYIIVPSRSNDPKKNPLDADTKVNFMRQMFPNHSEKIVNDPANRTIFDVLKKAHMDGYTNVRIVGGGDRVKEFEKLSNNYNGSLYQFDNIEVISAGERDPDSEDDVSGMSASRQRLSAAEGDFNTFLKGVPSSLTNRQARDLYNAVRASMKINENLNIWEIAPKFDWKNLRENYITGKIFKECEIIENLNTGLIGKIIRRGTNYLICVTEDNIMFKSWIRDVQEVYCNDSKKYGVPANKREVGTDSYREYVQNLTPIEKIKSFINKNRKVSN
jgi:hypothetical protein